MSVSQIRVTLNLDDKGSAKLQKFIRGLDGIERKIAVTNKSVKNLEGSMGGFMGKLRDVLLNVHILSANFGALAHATAGLHVNLIRTNAEIERTSFLMRGLSNATSDAGKQMEADNGVDYLLDFAERAPFALNQLSNSFVKMRTVGIDPMQGSLLNLTDAVASFGGDNQLLHRASVAIQQMMGKGVVSMEELRQQLGEAVPTALKSMAKAAGVSIGELVNKVASGTIEAESAIKQMFGQFEREMGGSGARMMESWSGMMSILETRWMKFQLQVGDSDMFKESKYALQELIDTLDPESTRGFAQALGSAMGKMTQALTQSAIYIKENFYQIQNTVAMVGKLALLYVGMKVALSGLSAVTKGYSRAQEVWKKSAEDVLKEYKKQHGLLDTTNVKLKKANGGIMTITKSAKVMGASIYAALGPLGLLAVAVSGAIALYEIFGATSRKAFNDAAEGAAILTEKQLALTKLQTAAVGDEILKLEERIAKGKTGGRRLSSNTLDRMRNDLQELKSQHSDVMQSIAEAEESFSESRVNSAVNFFSKLVEAESEIAKSAYREDSELLFNQLQNKLIDQEEYSKKHLALVLKLALSERAILKGKRQSLEMQLFEVDGSNAEELKILNTELDEIGKKLVENQRKIVAYQAQVTSGLKQINSESKSRFLKYVDKQNASLKSLSLGATKAEQAVIQFKERVKSGFFDDKNYKASKLTNEELERYADLVRKASLAQQNAEIRTANYKKALSGLGELFASQKQRIQDVKEKIAELDGVSGQKGVSKLTGQITEMLAVIPGASAYVDHMTASIAKLDATAKNLDIVSKLKQIQNATGNDIEVLNVSQNPSLLRDMQKELQKVNDLERQRIEGGAEASRVQEEAMKAQIAITEKYSALNRDLANKEVLAYQNKTSQVLASLGTEKVQKEQAHMAAIAQINAEFALSKTMGDERMRLDTARMAYIEALNKQHAENMKTPVMKLADEWQDISKGMDDVWASGMQGMADSLTDFVTTGKASFEDFTKSILKMILKIMIQKQIAGLVGAMFGGGGAVTSASMFAEQASFGGGAIAPFANGGIMTGSGSMPLKMYSTGGIANSPQLAMFGEGSRPEAYVPLPDGRTIPVTMAGGAGGRVEVNVINNSNSQASAKERNTPNGKVIDVMIEQAVESGLSSGRFDRSLSSNFGINRAGV